MCVFRRGIGSDPTCGVVRSLNILGSAAKLLEGKCESAKGSGGCFDRNVGVGTPGGERVTRLGTCPFYEDRMCAYSI
jgi:hypothetical protein